MLSCYLSTNLEILRPTTSNHGNLEIWRSTNLQAWKINPSQPGGPQGASGYFPKPLTFLILNPKTTTRNSIHACMSSHAFAILSLHTMMLSVLRFAVACPTCQQKCRALQSLWVQKLIAPGAFPRPLTVKFLCFSMISFGFACGSFSFVSL